MNDDLIEKAEAMANGEQCEYEHCKLPEMICELVAEIKRLQNQIEACETVSFYDRETYYARLEAYKKQLVNKDEKITGRNENFAEEHL